MDNREKGGLKMECIKINLFKGMIRRVKRECSENVAIITPRFIYDELESIHENIFCNPYKEENNVYIVPNSCDDKPIKFKIGE